MEYHFASRKRFPVPKAIPINLLRSFDVLTRLEDRTPDTTDDESGNSFAMISEFRDGGAFVSTFSGIGEWERHSNGDELVFAVEGQTDLVLLIDGEERRNTLDQGSLIVVPKSTWHRFETNGVKILSLTPQPTDHYSGEVPPD